MSAGNPGKRTFSSRDIPTLSRSTSNPARGLTLLKYLVKYLACRKSCNGHRSCRRSDLTTRTTRSFARGECLAISANIRRGYCTTTRRRIWMGMFGMLFRLELFHLGHCLCKFHSNLCLYVLYIFDNHTIVRQSHKNTIMESIELRRLSLVLSHQ